MRQALRALRRRPALNCVAILVLALGIGVNTAVFESHVVVGVMPAGSESGCLGWKDLWTRLPEDEALTVGQQRWRLGVLGRLRDGARVDPAEAVRAE